MAADTAGGKMDEIKIFGQVFLRHQINLLKAIDFLQSLTRGSSEVYEPVEERIIYNYLKWRLENWHDSCVKRKYTWDTILKLLIMQTLKDYDDYRTTADEEAIAFISKLDNPLQYIKTIMTGQDKDHPRWCVLKI